MKCLPHALIGHTVDENAVLMNAVGVFLFTGKDTAHPCTRDLQMYEKKKMDWYNKITKPNTSFLNCLVLETAFISEMNSTPPSCYGVRETNHILCN